MVRRCILLLHVGRWGFSVVLEGRRWCLNSSSQLPPTAASKGTNPAVSYTQSVPCLTTASTPALSALVPGVPDGTAAPQKHS